MKIILDEKDMIKILREKYTKNYYDKTINIKHNGVVGNDYEVEITEQVKK